MLVWGHTSSPFYGHYCSCPLASFYTKNKNKWKVQKRGGKSNFWYEMKMNFTISRTWEAKGHRNYISLILLVIKNSGPTAILEETIKKKYERSQMLFEKEKLRENSSDFQNLSSFNPALRLALNSVTLCHTCLLLPLENMPCHMMWKLQTPWI